MFWSILQRFGWYMFKGAGITLGLTLASLGVTIVIGLVLLFMRLSRRKWLNAIAMLYVEVVRGTPLLLHLFLVYFGLTSLGIKLSPFAATVSAFGFNGGAFMSEIFRSGVLSVEKGQLEAAKSLGMRYRDTMFRIILPQALYVVLPPMVNFSIELLKGTSLALIIAVPEVTYRAYNAISQTYRTFEVLVIAGLVYLAFAYPMSRLVLVLEHRLSQRGFRG